MVLLWSILKAIRVKYKENRQNNFYIEEIAVYVAVVPWGAMTIIAYFQFSQLTEAIVSNLGFLVVTSMFIFRFTRQDRNAISKLKDISINGIRPEMFEENCINFEFTTRETEVIRLLQEGYSTGNIATRLFISERTVTTHIQNMMAKTKTHSRLELLRKLEIGVLDM